MVGTYEHNVDSKNRIIIPAPEEDASVRELRRFLYAFTDHLELDKQGRIVIPSRLKAFSMIQDEVVIVGQSKYVEIWAKENWSWDFDFEGNDPNNLLSSIAKYKNPPVANS